MHKTPPADLIELDPGKPDEKAHGCTYEQIDDFQQGRSVQKITVVAVIIAAGNTLEDASETWSNILMVGSVILVTVPAVFTYFLVQRSQTLASDWKEPSRGLQ